MITLDKDRLKAIFERMVKDPENNRDALADFAEILKPVIKLTVERYPQNMQDDMGQELLVAMIRKSQHIATIFCKGEIKNITNYIFRFLSNASINFYRREHTYQERFVSIEGVGDANFLAKPPNYKRQHVLDQIRDELPQYLKDNLPNPKDRARAAAFINPLLHGEKPSFDPDEDGKRQTSAKELYSIVLGKLKERLEYYHEDLTS